MRARNGCRRADVFEFGSIVAAIANYTTRVVQTGLAQEQTLEALLFLGECNFQFDTCVVCMLTGPGL